MSERERAESIQVGDWVTLDPLFTNARRGQRLIVAGIEKAQSQTGILFRVYLRGAPRLLDAGWFLEVREGRP